VRSLRELFGRPSAGDSTPVAPAVSRTWNTLSTLGAGSVADVDPSGAIYPRNRPVSIEVWFGVGERWMRGGRSDGVRQTRIVGLPIVETRQRVGEDDLVQTAWADEPGDGHGRVVLHLANESDVAVVAAVVVRPKALIGDGHIEDLRVSGSLIVADKVPLVEIGRTPGDCVAASETNSDAPALLEKLELTADELVGQAEITDPNGRASIAALIPLTPGVDREIQILDGRDVAGTPSGDEALAKNGEAVIAVAGHALSNARSIALAFPLIRAIAAAHGPEAAEDASSVDGQLNNPDDGLTYARHGVDRLVDGGVGSLRRRLRAGGSGALFGWFNMALATPRLRRQSACSSGVARWAPGVVRFGIPRWPRRPTSHVVDPGRYRPLSGHELVVARTELAVQAFADRRRRVVRRASLARGTPRAAVGNRVANRASIYAFVFVHRRRIRDQRPHRRSALAGAHTPRRRTGNAKEVASVSTVRQLRTSLKKSAPGLRHERALWDVGVNVVAGMDEVGKGAWAGPLTVGAAIVPKDRRIYKVRDSKLLNEAEREAMFDRIAQWCEAWSVGHASHAECDELGMSNAQRLAAQRALDGLGVYSEKVLLDGKWDFVGGGRAKTIVRGERESLSIAAASILAKVTRDRMMRELDGHFPAYWLDENKGYPCHRHRSALHLLGPSTVHRRSWAYMDGLEWRGITRFVPDDGQGTLFV